MDILDQLTKKVQTAAHELQALKKEKQQLLSEVELLRQELTHQQHAMREVEEFKRNQERLRTRLEKLGKKIDRHLMSDQPMSFAGGRSRSQATSTTADLPLGEPGE
jgi:predicted  nucleic acid-binding Zn-ribbon protein